MFDRRIELGLQATLIAGAALLYFAVRGLTEGSEALAVANGLDLLSAERALGLAIEADLQAMILDHRWAVTAANWVYIWGHWPAIAVTLVWLHRTRRPDYLLLRNALFVSGAIGLVIFVLHPVAPPRLLPSGFTDTVTELSTSYRVLQPPSLVNKYAALPSLHVGWNLLIGVALVRTRANRLVWTIGLISPVLMAAAVVLTGNHYVVDAVAGSIVALIGLAVSYRVTPALPAAVDPLLKMRALRADRGVVTVAGQHDGVGGKREQAGVDRLDDRSEVASLVLGGTGSAGEQRVAAEQERLVDDLEADRTRRVAGSGDRVELGPSDLDDGVVFEEVVIGRQHGGIGRGDTDLVPGVTNLGNGLDVVPVPVGLQDSADPEGTAKVEEHFVLVGRVEQDGVTAVAAPDHEYVVVDRTDDDLVDLEVGVGPVERLGRCFHATHGS